MGDRDLRVEVGFIVANKALQPTRFSRRRTRTK